MGRLMRRQNLRNSWRNLVLAICWLPILGQSLAHGEPGDAMLAEYFRQETEQLRQNCLQDIQTKEDWLARRDTYRQQLFDMLGLDPLPARGDLHAQTTGTHETEHFIVETVQFQSLPGLYVTGNLYLPKNRSGKAPTVLYVCGHGRFKIGDVSYGNKVSYQHHGGWFARNGYVCLTIDTLQMGEIEGIHHGTYRKGMWWWNSRGYTPAGVEAWNCIRALDYLQQRPEVDPKRIGATGRSGGGAYTWWIAALDDRIRVAVPVAGITDLTNHVVDGCVEGHCDCMYMVNTYRWDYPQVAALVAPRPMLIVNTDRDSIFPLDGVVRTHAAVSKIYELLGAEDQLGLQISEGPHKDTQNLQVAAGAWFHRFLKNDDSRITDTGVHYLSPQDLKVFDELPTENRNAEIQSSFVPQAEVAVPQNREAWQAWRNEALKKLLEQSFRGWPEQPGDLDIQVVHESSIGDVQHRAIDFTSQHGIRLRMFLVAAEAAAPTEWDLHILDEQNWRQWARAATLGFGDALGEIGPPGAESKTLRRREGVVDFKERGQAFLAPRGIGLTAWTSDERERVHIRRRFMLLGQTLDGMRVWDIYRGVQALQKISGSEETTIHLHAAHDMAGAGLYAALFEPRVASLQLEGLATSHHEGIQLLNVLKFMDMPQAVAMAAEQIPVRLRDASAGDWSFPQAVLKVLDVPVDRLQITAK